MEKVISIKDPKAEKDEKDEKDVSDDQAKADAEEKRQAAIRVRDLDQDEVVRLMTKHQTSMLAFANALTRDPEFSEDVVQEANVIIIKKAHLQTNSRYFPMWARGVVKNLSMRMMRDRGRRRNIVESNAVEILEGAWEKYDDIEEARLRKTALKACIEELPSRSKEIIKLRYYDEMNVADLAKKIDRSFKGIYVSLSRIHKALANCVAARFKNGLS